MSPIQHASVGPFALDAIVGRGGMGLVYRATHILSGADVALKVVTGQLANSPEYHHAFELEVEAMARLEHPGILTVYDHGVVKSDVDGLNSSLAAGSPWFAMELANAGSLTDSMPQNWLELRKLLMEILDALAHAHARDIVHRDLKPANILLNTSGIQRRYKLSDFGIAHAIDSDPVRQTSHFDQSAGTPLYMSPEQFYGRWRSYGPWTDLYSLGCLAYHVCCGRPPFVAPTLHGLADRHLHEPPPPLVPLFAVPEGLDGWVSQLLAKQPADRYRRAADAAWDLGAIADDNLVPARALTSGGEVGLEAPTLVSDLGRTTEVSPAPCLATLSASGVESPAGERVDSPAGWRARLIAETSIPPIPVDWRGLQVDHGPVSLMGLGLFGLREVPFVGRQAERDAIWDALRRVSDTGQAEAVLLRGESGAGKSRLAEWISQRAHEVGAAMVMKASHGPVPGRPAGIRGMVQTFLRCIGLSRDKAYKRVREVLATFGASERDVDADAPALVELMIPAEAASQDAVPPIIFRSAQERYIAVLNAIERFGEERPIIVWLDDVQWGADALWFTRYVLELQQLRPAPLLFLLTVREESLLDRPMERQLIDQLTGRRCVSECLVDRLAPDEHAELIEGALKLEGDLAAHVAARTDGHPLFAIQVVGDWVQRHALVATRRGFALAESGDRDLVPDDVYALFRARLAALAGEEEDPGAVNKGLMIGACLGHHVVASEWFSICRRVELRPPQTLASRLVGLGLAFRREGYWEFAHGMFRETLLELARETGLDVEIHLACAAMLEERGSRDPRILERRARHLMAGGRPRDAVQPLIAAADALTMTGDTKRAEELIDVASRALSASRLPAADPLRGTVLAAQARNKLPQHNLEHTRKLAKRLAHLAVLHGWLNHEAAAHQIEGECLRLLGAQRQARVSCVKALELFKELKDYRGMAHTYQSLGHMSLDAGLIEDAEKRLQLAAQASSSAGDELLEVMVSTRLVDVYLAQDKYRAATAHAEHMMEVLQRRGARTALGLTSNALGEIERAQGHHARALEHYAAALRLRTAQGTAEVGLVELNIALAHQGLGRHTEAAESLASLATMFQRAAMDNWGRYALLLSLCSWAHLARLDKIESILADFEADRMFFEWSDRDTATSAQHAGVELMNLGHRALAARCLRLSEGLWSQIEGRTRELEVVRGLLSGVAD